MSFRNRKDDLAHGQLIFLNNMNISHLEPYTFSSFGPGDN